MTDSNRWLKRHFSDPYVKRAQQEGFRSRAAYKLLEIQEKDRLIKPGMMVIDLGAAPGSWSMVASNLVGRKGHVIALDILPMDPIPGVMIITGDFNDQNVYDQLEAEVKKESKDGKVDLVISDMAPHISGEKSIDQPRSLHLVELAWDCSKVLLRKKGSFLFKVFQGSGVDVLLLELKSHFKQVKVRKPKSSRARSSEIFVLASEFLGYNEN